VVDFQGAPEPAKIFLPARRYLEEIGFSNTIWAQFGPRLYPQVDSAGPARVRPRKYWPVILKTRVVGKGQTGGSKESCNFNQLQSIDGVPPDRQHRFCISFAGQSDTA
jgi:hypothetical protein